jgi:hypothetical protein
MAKIKKAKGRRGPDLQLFQADDPDTAAGSRAATFFTNEQQVRLGPGKDVVLPKSHVRMMTRSRICKSGECLKSFMIARLPLRSLQLLPEETNK